MAYFGGFEGELFDAFMTVAKGSENVNFFHAPSDCAAPHGASAHGVSLFRDFDNSPVHFDASHNFEALNTFLDVSSVPTLITFHEDYIETIFGKARTTVILFTNEAEAAYNAVWAEAASALKGDVLFVVSGTKDGIQNRLAEFVGVENDMTPTIRLLVPGDEMAKFLYPHSA